MEASTTISIVIHTVRLPRFNFPFSHQYSYWFQLFIPYYYYSPDFNWVSYRCLVFDWWLLSKPSFSIIILFLLELFTTIWASILSIQPLLLFIITLLFQIQINIIFVIPLLLFIITLLFQIQINIIFVILLLCCCCSFIFTVCCSVIYLTTCVVNVICPASMYVFAHQAPSKNLELHKAPWDLAAMSKRSWPRKIKPTSSLKI